MKNFVGIDLGTTNSAICSYDGSEIRIWKSPEQNDVTPSAIYIDRRGNKYVGKRAYDAAPQNYKNAATLFKRIMGTSTPVPLPGANLTMTPEECSSEVLKVLFGYLPEEIRNDPETGTVITVPAAFNQMQKDATMQAASMAGIGKVALMQEPVAAVMSVMRAHSTDGMFLIYDLGGGTLDIAIADSTGGRVNLLAHGGKAMCGGRDFDRVLFDNIVKPWLLENFRLPEDFPVNPDFQMLKRLALWATERAKIELSAKEEAVVSLSEAETRVRDLNGDEIYLDVPLARDVYTKLIDSLIVESIEAARKVLENTCLSPHDLERIVFIGGPTNYKPLRDKVSFELGIPGGLEVNPMTAVAEGASVFAESIDWSSQTRARKNIRGQIASGGKLPLSFNYIARTPDIKAKIAVQLTEPIANGSEFQIDSLDTGWTSGRLPLKHGVTVDVALNKRGDNTFKVFVFDPAGGPIALEKEKIVITRTAATVEAIPASYSVGVEAQDKSGGAATGLVYLVRAGDSLPKKGKETFIAAETLKAGSSDSLNFKLWEGEIEDRPGDNRLIGVMKVSGSDFDDGVIPAGAELICEFEMLDSGELRIEVSIPCIGGTFRPGKNFYSRQEGQLDYTDAAPVVIEEGERTLERVNEISGKVEDPKLEQARRKLETAVSLDPDETEAEKSQEAMEKVLEAKKLLAQVRKEYGKEIHQIDLDHIVDFFDRQIRKHANPSEAASFDKLAKAAQRSIERNDKGFEQYLEELWHKVFEILWRQDWYVVELFKQLASSPYEYIDKARFQELVQRGLRHLQADEMDRLRSVIIELYRIRIHSSSENSLQDIANIIRG